jgi:predicted transcriptional regulator
MKIMMPQELEVWYIIPAIRREFARVMLNRGLSQRKIAETLGVTEAAVSQYKKSKRASGIEFKDGASREIGNSVDRIIHGGCVVKETQKICDLCKADLTLCELHHRFGVPNENCRVCLE